MQKKVVTDFGGMTQTARLLTDNGVTISRDTVDKWRRAKRIPHFTLQDWHLLPKNVVKDSTFMTTS